MATQFDTYTQVGKKEDVSDVITNISPTLTPFQTLIKGEKVHNTVYQWQEDSLNTVAQNAVVEGVDAVDSTMNPTVMRSNYTQIMQKTVRVTGTADTVATYGRAKELAYQLSKKSAEVKREMEYMLVGMSQDAAIGSSSVARTFGNVWGHDATATLIQDASVIVDNTATPKALNEADVLTANQNLYNAGAEANYIMVKPSDSVLFASFAQAAGRMRNFGADKSIVNVVNLYVSPFGEQKVLINRFLKADRCMIFDPQYFKLMTLRPWTREQLAKTGDAERHQLLGEFGFKKTNYKATTAILGCTGTNPNAP